MSDLYSEQQRRYYLQRCFSAEFAADLETENSVTLRGVRIALFPGGILKKQ